MVEKSRLEELSMALPEKERKELLERIAKRMERDDGEEAIHVELKEDEREKIIAYELSRTSLWVRFRVWLRTLISGRTKKEVFLAIRLQQLKSGIRGVSPGLTGFETRDLTPKLARKLYDLYLRVRPLLVVYHALGSDKAVKAAAYSYLVERRYAQAKTLREEFVANDEMEEIYERTGQAEEIRNKLGLRLNEYIRGIPESLIQQLEEQARFHLYLGRLAAFPFASLFRYFNHVLAETEAPKYPSFEHAPAMLTIDLLEKLHVALSLIHRCAPDYPYAEEPLAFYCLVRAGIRPGEESDSAKVEKELGTLRAAIVDLGKEIETFEKAVPLLDLVRYFRRDPWHQLVWNPPRLYLKSIYFAALKARIGLELEDGLGTIQERVMGRKIQEMLKGQRMTELTYYRENPEFDFRSLGLPYFGGIRSLALAWNYLLQQFKGTVQEAAQIVVGTALANNRITQNRLAQGISTLEDLDARIVLFDRSLSPEEEDGKQLARFRAGIGNDLLLQKSYRAFIARKDREARDLVEKVKENLTAVRKVFDEIRTSTFENTRALLKTLHVYKGRNQTLGQILNDRSEAIGAFLGLLDQLLEIEKGA